MKSPKLFGQPGATMAKGRAKARALQGTGAPFLTARGPGYTARMKNGFLKVEVDETATEPTKLPYWATDGLYVEVNAAPRKKEKQLTGIPYASPEGVRMATTHAIWVAKERLLTLRQDNVDFPIADSKYWPVLLNPTTAEEVLPGDELELKRGVSFQLSNSTDYYIRSIFASGQDATHHRWGYSFVPISASRHYPFVLTPTAPAALPTAYIGGIDRESGVIVPPTAVALPSETGRVHYGAAVFCVGPGKLMTLIAVAEQYSGDDISVATYLKPRIDPYLCTSDDHGATWSRTTASFLVDGLATVWALGEGVPSPGNRLVLLNPQLRGALDAFFAVYIGDGVSLLFIPELTTSWTTSRYVIRCFRYEAGVATPIAWVGDTISFGYLDTVGQGFVGYRCVSACFGKGCAVVSRTESGNSNNRLVSTRDFGASWHTSAVTPWLTERQPVVLQPYENADRPGKILFVGLALGGSGGSDVWQTDGTFTEFKHLGKLTRSGLYTKYMVPFLDRTKFNLALPDEFGPPA